MGLRPSACWDPGFESHQWHGCLSLVKYWVLSDRGLCVGLITRPEESYRRWCVWVWSTNLDKRRPRRYFGCGAAGKERKILKSMAMTYPIVVVGCIVHYPTCMEWVIGCLKWNSYCAWNFLIPQKLFALFISRRIFAYEQHCHYRWIKYGIYKFIRWRKRGLPFRSLSHRTGMSLKLQMR
jgi:hypothetical protein